MKIWFEFGYSSFFSLILCAELARHTYSLVLIAFNFLQQSTLGWNRCSQPVLSCLSNDHRPLPQLHYPLGQGHIQRYKRSQIRSDIQISFYKKNWGTSIFHHPPRTVDLNCTEHLGRGASPAILNMISYDYLNTDLTFLLTFGNPPLTQLRWLLGWGQIRYFWSYLIFYIYSTKTLYIFRILCRAWLL